MWQHLDKIAASVTCYAVRTTTSVTQLLAAKDTAQMPVTILSIRSKVRMLELATVAAANLPEIIKLNALFPHFREFSYELHVYFFSFTTK